MKILDQETPPLGIGCWPIGGALWSADGAALGYTNTNDTESIRAIHAAIDHGVTVFDTAAAYGAGHSERLLAKALKQQPDALVISKIGLAIDESSRTLLGEDSAPESVIPAIDASLGRLQRDTIDVVLLHINELSHDKAKPIFDEMERARSLGKIRAYGWSTDFTESIDHMAPREGFAAVEHAMHVLMDAPYMQKLIQERHLTALIRSPLAMGLLSGKYTVDHQLPSDDVRASNQGWVSYYIDGKPNPVYVEKINAIRELLKSDGRTEVQGALAWLWARSPSNLALPGARTVKQVVGLAGALHHGPLSPVVMSQIDELVGSDEVSDGKSAR